MQMQLIPTLASPLVLSELNVHKLKEEGKAKLLREISALLWPLSL